MFCRLRLKNLNSIFDELGVFVVELSFFREVMNWHEKEKISENSCNSWQKAIKFCLTSRPISDCEVQVRAHGSDTRSTPIADIAARVWLVLLCTLIVAVPSFLAPREVAQARSVASAALDQMGDLETQLRNAWMNQNWSLAIQTIEQILALDASRGDMLENLYSAHVNYGYQLYAQGQYQQAYDQFAAALQIKPTGEEAQAGITLINAAGWSGTPGPTLTHTPVTPGAPTATPSPGPSPTGTLPAASIQHVVRTGDTLYSLARDYNTTVQAIMQANGLGSYIIWIGQVLIIPVGGALPPGPLMHIVLPGETLYSLARYYQTTVQAIMWVNGLWSYMIYAGQPLLIPTGSPSGGGVHVVQWGETLCSIARLYGTTVDAIMVANSLTSDFILAGMELNIP